MITRPVIAAPYIIAVTVVGMIVVVAIAFRVMVVIAVKPNGNNHHYKSSAYISSNVLH